MMALLFPFAVWRGEPRFGVAFLWTLPVDRRTHALTKVLGGWVWLMAAVTLLLLWMLLLAAITGGQLGGERTAVLLPTPIEPALGTLPPSALRTMRWTPSPLLWLVPFTGATGAYLLGSAIALGVRHPLRWLAGAALVLLVVSEVGLLAHSREVALLPARAFAALLYGPYGFDTLLTARSESLHVAVTLADGRRVTAWRELPDVGRWIGGTLLWTGTSLLALWAAASRHGERRRR
jgi:hypothetical protein